MSDVRPLGSFTTVLASTHRSVPQGTSNGGVPWSNSWRIAALRAAVLYGIRHLSGLSKRSMGMVKLLSSMTEPFEGRRLSYSVGNPSVSSSELFAKRAAGAREIWHNAGLVRVHSRSIQALLMAAELGCAGLSPKIPRGLRWPRWRRDLSLLVSSGPIPGSSGDHHYE